MNEIAVAIYQACFTHTDRLDFRTSKDDTCCEDINKFVVERSSLVLYVDAL
jgi:hypothetical protein